MLQKNETRKIKFFWIENEHNHVEPNAIENEHEGHDHSEHEHEHDNEADENESHEHSENCNHDHENEFTTHPETMRGIVKKEISLVDKYFWAIINHNIPITIVLSTLFISFGYSLRKSLSVISIFGFAN